VEKVSIREECSFDGQLIVSGKTYVTERLVKMRLLSSANNLTSGLSYIIQVEVKMMLVFPTYFSYLFILFRE